MNENVGKNYDLKPLLAIIDKILSEFYEENYWGYSLPNYISASHNAHPNYAGYLDDKKTLTFEDINNIFDMMEEEKKEIFDEKYIEELYLKHQEKERVQEKHIADFLSLLDKKCVLVIAPGQSTVEERDKIVNCSKQEKILTISINYDYDEQLTDFIFLSNLRRYLNLPPQKRVKSIVTSNIPALDVYLQVRYKDLLNGTDIVTDNAGLMLIKMLINFGVKKVIIAGMDGYSANPEENYAVQEMNLHTKRGLAKRKNIGMMTVLKEFQKYIEIEMLTTPKFVMLN